jgi:alkanesulfonate monooxygenase SsuD/methylene tetrahydromethanopterin reductase-like flavin-dependent oxidoreductase (luciferase family)
LLPLAERADAAGYDAIWVTDHAAIPRRQASYPNSASGQPPRAPDVDYLEPLTTLTYLAARTRQARVGTSVLVVPVRPPLVVVKMLASLDVLSGGRLIVGVGTGWLAEEFEALGVPWEPLADDGHGRNARDRRALRAGSATSGPVAFRRANRPG